MLAVIKYAMDANFVFQQDSGPVLSMIRYVSIRDGIFFVCSKADMSQLSLPRGTKKLKSEQKEELKSKNG